MTFTLQEEKKVHIVAVGYGVQKKINKTVLEEIGGENVLVMYRDPNSGYSSYASQIRDMVCGKLNLFSSLSVIHKCLIP